jgi:hypothetical protein
MASIIRLKTSFDYIKKEVIIILYPCSINII